MSRNDNVQTEPAVVLDLDWVREQINLHDLVNTMQYLHGPNFTLLPTELEMILDDPKEILVGVFDSAHVVSLAQATLVMSPPTWHVLINNVVTHGSYQRLGLGKRVLAALESEIKQRWLHDGLRLRRKSGLPPVPRIKMILTNSLARGNGGFYQAAGWISRGPDDQKPTIAWYKNLN